MIRSIPAPPRDPSVAPMSLGPWFNLDLQVVRPAPEHFLGDYPASEVAPLRAPRSRRT